MRILRVFVLAGLLTAACGSTPPGDDVSGSTIDEEPASTPASTADTGVVADPDGARASVKDLLVAANAGDPLGFLAAVDPAEREALSQIYASLVEGIERDWPHVAVETALPGLDPAIDVGRLDVEVLSSDLAWVSTDSVSLFLNDPAVLGYFTTRDGEWYPSDAIEIDDLAFDGPEFVSPGVVAVRIDGEWRVSFARTAAELIRRGYGLADRYGDTTIEIGPGAPSPIDAVAQFFEALESADIDAIRRTVTPGESATLGDVDAALGRLFSDMTSTGRWSARVADLTLVAEEDGRAIVGSGRLELGLRGAWESLSESGEWVSGDGDHVVTTDRACATLVWRVDDWSGCAGSGIDDGLVFAGVHDDLGWVGPRIAVVEVDGAWFVSIFETVQLVAEPLAAEPLFALVEFPGWEVPGYWVAMDEAARSLPLIEPGGREMLTPLAAGRIQMARVATGSAGGRIVVDVPGERDDDCELGVWLHELVRQDLDEGDEFREWAECDEPVDVPGGVTLVVQVDRGIGYGTAPPVGERATVWNDS
ncbi:MAG: hypothetical protein ACR2P0_20185 [Acidimicrobiales bacterium]